MHVEPDCDTLYVGLVSLNQRVLLSPDASRPELFTTPYCHEELVSTEAVARKLLGRQGIVTSSLYTLTFFEHPAPHTACGYLLRESQPVNLTAHAITPFSAAEVAAYTESPANPRSVHVHFLKQILQYMK